MVLRSRANRSNNDNSSAVPGGRPSEDKPEQTGDDRPRFSARGPGPAARRTGPRIRQTRCRVHRRPSRSPRSPETRRAVPLSPSRGEDSGARDTKTPSKPQPGSEAGSSVARFRPHVLSMETSVVGSSARCLCEVRTRPSDLAIRTKTKLSRRLVRRSKQTTQFNGPRSHSRTVAGVNGSHYPHGVLIQRRGP